MPDMMSSYIQLNRWKGNNKESACASMVKVFRLDHDQATKIISGLERGKSWRYPKVVSKNQLEVAKTYLTRLGFSLELIPVDTPLANPSNSFKPAALWTPNAVANWSVIFSPIFGGILVSKNWKTLSENKKAKSSMYWVYVTIAFWAAVPILIAAPDKITPAFYLVPTIHIIWAFLSLPILIIWYIISLRSQAKYVKNTFGETFTRKSWKKPLWFGVLVFLGWFIFIVAILLLKDDRMRAFYAYETGDYKTAYKLMLPLAEQGHADAQKSIGVLYRRGEGVKQDYKEAVKWYRLSAGQGYAKAQNELGNMYRMGKGVAKDYKEAVKWYTLAEASGSKNARKNRESLEIFMTPKQIAEAHKLAREWIEKQGSDKKNTNP